MGVRIDGGDGLRRRALLPALATAPVALRLDAAASSAAKPRDVCAFACTSPMTFDVGEGRHILAIAATDEAGNAYTTPASTTWLVKKRR